MTSIHTNRLTGMVAAFALCSWLGQYVHNLVEMPQMNLFSPENSLTLLVSLLLFVGWRFLPYRRLTASLLLIWALLHLIGGAVVTVLPFPFLPFYPEQSYG